MVDSRKKRACAVLFTGVGVVIGLVHVNSCRRAVVGDGRQRVVGVAVGERTLGVGGEERARVVAVGVCDDEIRAPLERAHDAIRVARGVMAFPDLYPAFEQLTFSTSAKI
jgi:hypothetical protein